jgi:hypothetical protein
MANSPTVSDDFAKKFATEKETPYVRWVRSEGLDIISAQYVANLRTVELKPWPRRGGNGVYINHDASRFSNDCYVCEIPAGGKLAPQRQLYEEMILVLDGRGSTSVWNDAGNASPSNGRPAPYSPSRSMPGTSISTARARRPSATSR